MNKVNVILVNEAPAIGKPEMMGGFLRTDAAQKWAEKNGYSTVYLWLARERVYADRLTKAVNVLAKQIETKSGRLVSLSEKGEGVSEFAIFVALIVIVLAFASNMFGWGWPW